MNHNTFIKAQVLNARIQRAQAIIDSLSSPHQGEGQAIREASLFLDIEDPIPRLCDQLQSKIHVKLTGLKEEFNNL